jgi:streptogramin lyase
MARAHASGLVGSAAAAIAFAIGGCVDGNIPPRPPVTFGSPIELTRAAVCEGVELAVRDGTLYWTDSGAGTVNSMPAEGPGDGGVFDVLVVDQVKPGKIVADATSIYWITDLAQSIARRPRVAGRVEQFVTPTLLPVVEGGENDINALLVDDVWLYFGRHIRAFKVPTAGLVAPMMIGKSPGEDDGRPSAFAADNTYLYQTEALHNAVTRVTTDGHQEGKLETGALAPFAPDRIAVSQGSLLLNTIALWRQNVVWANGPTIFRKPTGDLEDKPSFQVTTTAGGGDVSGFVVFGDAIYFGELGSDRLQRATLPTGTATGVASGQGSARRFVADSNAIYWSTDDCAIMRLPMR